MKLPLIYRGGAVGAGAPGVYFSPTFFDRRGMIATYRGTEEVSKSLIEFGQTVQTAVRRDLVSHAYSAAQKAIADAELEFKADPDHRTIPDRFKASLNAIREEHSAKIFDPVARNMFEQKMLEYGTGREIQMKFHVFDKEVEAQQAHLTEILDNKYDLIGGLPLEDQQSYGLYLREGFDAINERVATGMVSETSGVPLRREFKEKAARLKARQNIIIDPEGANQRLGSANYEQWFPGLNAETRLSLHESSRAVIDRNRAQQVALQEKIEKMADKEEKKRLAANYGNAVILYAKGDLTESFIEEAVDNRDLDPGKAYVLVRRLREDAKHGKTERNNPEIVGDLARRIALEEDVTEDLNSALSNGDIKDETFITMTANMAKGNVKKAFSYINKSMQPAEYETDFNLKQTWADAIDLLMERISRGEDPMISARDIVRSRRKRLPTPPVGRPRFLTGDLGMVSLDAALKETVEKFRAGEIGPVEANQEADLIERHQAWIKLQSETDETLGEMDKEFK